MVCAAVFGTHVVCASARSDHSQGVYFPPNTGGGVWVFGVYSQTNKQTNKKNCPRVHKYVQYLGADRRPQVCPPLQLPSC